MSNLGGDPTISVTGFKRFFAKTATEPRLVTIPNVEIMEVGENWPLSSGPQTFTEDDLLQVIAAIESDAAVKAPRLKLGWLEAREETHGGEPAFGVFKNIHLINNNQTMVGDLTGVPEWLAKIMPTAYANRSVEGMLDVTTATGKKWPLVLTSVALLGIEMPGISTLEDLREYWGDEPPAGTVINETIAASVAEDVKDENVVVIASHRRVVASIDIEDLRRSFYETVAAPGTDHYWWWIRCVQIDPQQVIVEDEDEGVLYRIPYSTSGDAVTWSDPIAVEIQYVDKGAVSAKSTSKHSTFYASADESRPAERSKMDPKQLRDTLGLAADASDADVTAKLTELQAAASGSNGEGEGEGGEGEPNPEGETAPEGKVPVAASAAPKIPEGMVLVDKNALEQIQAGASRATELWQDKEKTERDTFIAARAAKGCFPKSRVEHYATMWDADKEGTKALLASMAENMVPVEELGGSPGDGETGLTDEAYPAEWLSSQERRTVEASRAGELRDGAPGTITTERVGAV